MKRCGLVVLVCMALFLVGPASADENVQWIRVTVLLESGSESSVSVENLVVPGGVYSSAEVDRRGQEVIDREIVERVRFLEHSMRTVEESMRLATLVARQYYLSLEVGEQAVLPVIDLNPRLGVVFTLLRLEGGRAVCKVQFLEPEGPAGATVFSGEPITLTLQDADLQQVLAVFSKISPVSIEVDPAVSGKVTVDLRDVPWDQALDTVLRVNGLGWVREGDTLRVATLEELSRRRRVRTEATVSLPRGSWGSASIASRGDAANPTAVLIIESIDGRPGLAAERTGIVRPLEVRMLVPTVADVEHPVDEILVVRGTVTEDGALRDAAVLAPPSSTSTTRFSEALEGWSFRPVFDEQGRRQQAVVGFGVRLKPTRTLAAIGAVEHIGIDVAGKPAPPDYPDQYIISVVVTNLDTGQVIAAPRITTAKGQEAKVRSSFIAPSGEPSEFEMQVKVAEDASGVSYSWTMTTAGKVVSSHTAEFEL